MTQASEAPLITVVCTANVCRSVYAAHRLREPLGPWGIEVASAGVDVHQRSMPCPLVASRLGGAPAHRATALRSAVVARSALLLAMTARQRGTIGRAWPDARPRTFTLIEATVLAEEVARRSPGELTVDAFAAALGTLRGRVPMPMQRVAFGPPLRRTVRHDPDIDIPDGHLSDRRRDHRATLNSIESWTDRLATAMTVALRRPAPSSESRP